jgi:hypothetical protein
MLDHSPEISLWVRGHGAGSGLLGQNDRVAVTGALTRAWSYGRPESSPDAAQRQGSGRTGILRQPGFYRRGIILPLGGTAGFRHSAFGYRL